MDRRRGGILKLRYILLASRRHSIKKALIKVITNPEDLTQAVLKVMERTPDARLRDIMLSLVKHLHGFVKEVNLSEREFREATALIAQLGQQTHATHNEVVLMAGSLGVSSLVCLLNNTGEAVTETTQNLLGPFWRKNAPLLANGASLLKSASPGPALHMSAEVLDQRGQPVVGAQVDVWHCSANGLYEHQAQARAEGQAEMNLRGRFLTDAQGCFDFWSIKPSGYPIPTDGVVGQLVRAQDRHPMRPAHVHALIYKEGFKTLISQVYANDDTHLESDVQFGVTRAVVGDYELQNTPCPQSATPWYKLSFRFVMQEGEALLPRAPIQ